MEHRRPGPRRTATVSVAVVGWLGLLQTMAWAVDTCGDQSRGASGYSCFPAWRWRGAASQFLDDYTFMDVGAVAASGFPRMLFAIANFIWSITLWLIQQAMSVDVFGLSGIGRAIDAGFARSFGVAGPALAVPLFLVAVLVVAIRAARGASGGQSSGGWKDLVVPMTCLGVIFAMGAGATNASGTGRLAPSWWVTKMHEVSTFVGDDVIGGPASKALTFDVGQSALNTGAISAAERNNKLSCAPYMGELHRRGRAAVGSDASSIVSMTSSMWENAYLDGWIRAQYDNSWSGYRSYCRALEQLASISPAGQRSVHSGIAGAPPARTEHFANFNSSYRRAWYASFGICMYNGSQWRVAPGYEQLHMSTSHWRETVMRGSYPEDAAGWRSYCSSWWADADVETGSFRNPLHLDRNAIERATDINPNSLANTSTPNNYTIGMNEARRYLDGLRGVAIGRSGLSGLLAIGVALVFLMTLGGAALGAVLAQFGATAWVVLLPFILAVGVWPSSSAKQKVSKAMKLGIAMMFAKSVFTAILAVLVTLITLFNRVIDAMQTNGVVDTTGLAGGVPDVLLQTTAIAQRGEGAGDAFWAAVGPLVAYFVMKKLFKELGFGNPLGFGGAMRMVGNAAESATNTGSHRRGRMAAMAGMMLNPFGHSGPVSIPRQGRKLFNNRFGRSAGGRSAGRDRSRAPRAAQAADPSPTTGPTNRQRDAEASQRRREGTSRTRDVPTAPTGADTPATSDGAASGALPTAPADAAADLANTRGKRWVRGETGQWYRLAGKRPGGVDEDGFRLPPVAQYSAVDEAAVPKRVRALHEGTDGQPDHRSIRLPGGTTVTVPLPTPDSLRSSSAGKAGAFAWRSGQTLAKVGAKGAVAGLGAGVTAAVAAPVLGAVAPFVGAGVAFAGMKHVNVGFRNFAGELVDPAGGPGLGNGGGGGHPSVPGPNAPSVNPAAEHEAMRAAAGDLPPPSFTDVNQALAQVRATQPQMPYLPEVEQGQRPELFTTSALTPDIDPGQVPDIAHFTEPDGTVTVHTTTLEALPVAPPEVPPGPRA